jgi:hypothetical protein
MFVLSGFAVFDPRTLPRHMPVFLLTYRSTGGRDWKHRVLCSRCGSLDVVTIVRSDIIGVCWDDRIGEMPVPQTGSCLSLTSSSTLRRATLCLGSR